MNFVSLKRYLELTEQIKLLSEELESIKLEILSECERYAEDKVMFEVGGIQYGRETRHRTKTDLEAMTFDLGAETISKYQSTLEYDVTVVKATSKALRD